MQTWDTRNLDIDPHRPQVLRSDTETRAILIDLPAGEQLQEHQVHERAFLFVADGEITIEQGGIGAHSSTPGVASGTPGVVSGGPGLLAHFEPNERRTISAVSNARLVLVLAPWPGVGHPSERSVA